MKDKYEVIRKGNITFAQGYKCNDCNLIRSYYNPVCSCKPKVKITITEARQLQSIMEELNLMQKRSLFERFYDLITNIISNGKSFAPNELKTFR